MDTPELLAVLVPGTLIVSESGLLGWSWYWALRARRQAASPARGLPLWIVALATMDFAGLGVFFKVLGNEGIYPLPEGLQKGVVLGGVLVALAAGGIAWRRSAPGRIPFSLACLLLAAVWLLLGYLLFVPIISGPVL